MVGPRAVASRSLPSGVGVRDVETSGVVGPLAEIERKNAPRRLWIAGTLRVPLPHPRVAIVGTRRPSAAGQARATEIARALAGAGVTVISGLARGIDTLVHTAALRADGSTVAVIGTPISRAYPPENWDLQRKLMREQLVVSEYPKGAPTRPGNFVRRNRTMALLSDASVIVESGNTGGSLSHGWECLGLGRPLFIHDSEFRKPELTWPTEMARYGAIRFGTPDDVLEEIPTNSPSPERVARTLDLA